MNITNACSPAEDEGAVAVTKRAPGRGGQAPLRGCAGRGIPRLAIERIAKTNGSWASVRGEGEVK